MDNFMDRVSQKLSPQELIRANAEADAAALENLETQLTLFKDQMQKYDECLQEMRKLNLKNMESAQGVQELTVAANEKLGKAVVQMEAASLSKIQETSDISIAGINQTLSESLAKIAEIKDNPEAIEKITSDLSGVQTRLEELFRNLEEYLHTDNVKVYRNVQASMIEELDKQTTAIREEQEKLAKSSKMVLPFVIVTMIIAIANIAITVARILGLF